MVQRGAWAHGGYRAAGDLARSVTPCRRLEPNQEALPSRGYSGRLHDAAHSPPPRVVVLKVAALTHLELPPRGSGFMKVIPHLGVLPTALGLVAWDVANFLIFFFCTTFGFSLALLALTPREARRDNHWARVLAVPLWVRLPATIQLSIHT